MTVSHILSKIIFKIQGTSIDKKISHWDDDHEL